MGVDSKGFSLVFMGEKSGFEGDSAGFSRRSPGIFNFPSSESSFSLSN